MLTGISKTAASVLPIASYACYAAALYAGRKFGFAAGCKAISLATDLLGQEKAAMKWEQASHEYWTLAKKDAKRDLTAVAGLAYLGLASGYAGEALREKEPEPGLHIKAAAKVLNFLDEYKLPIAFGTGVWICRRPIARANLLTKTMDLGVGGLQVAGRIASSIFRSEIIMMGRMLVDPILDISPMGDISDSPKLITFKAFVLAIEEFMASGKI
jgi:hypothetical protein